MQNDTVSGLEETLVDDMIARARRAQVTFAAQGTQAKFDQAALAAAWALMEPERNQRLSALAVETTGLGNVADKIRKNHRKTLGLLRDIQHAKTCGVLSHDDTTGITEIARPIGVVGAVVPSTNPAATPTNNIINALKCGNAIVVSPSPKGVTVCAELIDAIHTEFNKIGVDPDLVQMVPAPSSKIKTQRLMEECDLIIVTGSQDNVRRAYSSGTPAIGVGAGNATVIVDESADLAAAARKIAASKTFDNATSCSSENGVIVLESVREAFLAELHHAGGRLLDTDTAAQVRDALFQNGNLNRHMIARDLPDFLKAADVTVNEPESAKFVVIETEQADITTPVSGEKLSLAVALYTATDFEHAKQLLTAILDFQGAGHSVGVHTNDDSRALTLGHELPTCRVIVNQAHCFATGGSFDNGLPFSLSMGCGSWGGNSIDDNLNYRHFMNITKVVRPITPREPALDEVFGEYWQTTGVMPAESDVK